MFSSTTSLARLIQQLLRHQLTALHERDEQTKARGPDRRTASQQLACLAATEDPES
jgi:hypothetical protein